MSIRKQSFTRICLLLLSMILLGTVASCVKMENPERKAYKEYLSGEQIYWYPYRDVPTSELEYDIKDINNDGVAELMIADHNVANGWGFYRLYTYHNSKMELVWSAVNGSGPGEYYSGLKLFVTERLHQGVYEKVYYSFEELPLRQLYSASEVARDDMESENGFIVTKEFRNEDWEVITEVQFENGIKELLGDATAEKFEFKKVGQ